MHSRKIDFDNIVKEDLGSILKDLYWKKFVNYNKIGDELYELFFEPGKGYKDHVIPDRIRYLSTTVQVSVPTDMTIPMNNVLDLTKQINPSIYSFIQNNSDFSKIVVEYTYNRSGSSFDKDYDAHRINIQKLRLSNNKTLEIIAFINILNLFYMGEKAKPLKITKIGIDKINRLIAKQITLIDILKDPDIANDNFDYGNIITLKNTFCSVKIFGNQILLTSNFKPYEDKIEFRMLEILERKLKENI